MKKLLLFLSIFTVLCIGIPKTAEASHYTGCDLTYACVGGNDYLITITFFRDCSGILPENPITVDFTSSCYSGFSTTFPQVGLPVSIPTTCSAQPNCCDYPYSGCTYGVQEYIFQKQVTLPACSDWVISWTSAARNPSNNLLNSTSQNWYICATLNNLDAPCHTSPQFSNFPVFVGCVNQPFCYNQGAIDPDGDSLVYSLVAPLQSISTPVDYVSPYSVSYPMPSSPPLSIDPVTGDICMNATQNFIVALATKIEEWRNIGGVPTMIGSVVRDIQINLMGNCNNSIPVLAGINRNATQYSANDTTYIMSVFQGDTIDFNVYPYDADVPAQNLSLTYTEGISTGVWSVTGNGTPNAVGHFHWQPTAGLAWFPQCFTVNVQDDACPFVGQQTILYCILDTTTASINSYGNGNSAFDIYPNPAKEIINIIFDNKTDDFPIVELYTIDGKQLQNIPIKEKNTEVNISALPKGIYFIKLTNSNGTFFRKMIKE